MYGLSLKQPYAWLILQRAYEDDPHKPIKPVENRSWLLPSEQVFPLPQRIYVHASLGMYDASLQEIKDLMTATQWLRQREALHAIYGLWETYKSRRDELRKFRYFGHILGKVTITGQMGESLGKRIVIRGRIPDIDSPWFFGPYGYGLEDPEILAEAIPYRGALKFFNVDLREESKV
jgi:hypothetical protein